jgi:hypothetical protein
MSPQTVQVGRAPLHRVFRDRHDSHASAVRCLFMRGSPSDAGMVGSSVGIGSGERIGAPGGREE